MKFKDTSGLRSQLSVPKVSRVQTCYLHRKMKSFRSPQGLGQRDNTRRAPVLFLPPKIPSLLGPIPTFTPSLGQVPSFYNQTHQLEPSLHMLKDEIFWRLLYTLNYEHKTVTQNFPFVEKVGEYGRSFSHLSFIWNINIFENQKHIIF